MGQSGEHTGRSGKADDFFDAVYRELRMLAGGALRQQRPDHTLQPTALVQEAWLKLSNASGEVHDREHFLALASTAMGQVLQDHARARPADKRGQREPGEAVFLEAVTTGAGEVDVIVLDDVLSRLSSFNEQHARIAELRILGGLTMPVVSSVLGVALRTAELDWKLARAWLCSELSETT